MTQTTFKSGLSPQYILRASCCRKPHCVGEYEQRHGGVASYQEAEIDNLQWANGYAEPGYQDAPRGVLLANWNYFPSEATDVLENAGFAIEWSDEWSTCDECGKLVRTSANSYSWQASYVIFNECEIVCHNCVDWEQYLESIEDNPRAAVVHECNPADYGYELISQPAEYESGLHPGQNDKPAAILAKLHERGIERVIFRVPETSQFYITFETWRKRPETDEEEN